MNVVVDASVLVKWYVVEEDFEPEAEYLADERFVLHAPELIIPEIGNILWKKHRRGELNALDINKIITESGLENELTLHSHEPLFESSVKGAIETGQTVYDWMYLSLALALSTTFVTADRRFLNAIKTTRYADHLLWIGDVHKLTLGQRL